MNERRQEFCMECATHKVFPKQCERKQRAPSRQDLLEKRYAEMRAAIAERDRYRREAEAVKQELRAEVRDELRRELRKQFWLLFALLAETGGAAAAYAAEGTGGNHER
jgi:predicted nuclease of restriction endonuclease-like RecB superfamily